MRVKLLFTNILLALALPLGSTGARADSETGAANITIGSTAVFSGTSGLLYGASSLVQSLAATITPGSGTISTTVAFGNNITLALTTDQTITNAALFTLTGTSATGGGGHLMEVNNFQGGTNNLGIYIDNGMNLYSTLSLVVSGHYSAGANPGGHSGGGFSILAPTPYAPIMIGCWADVTGACFMARNNAGAAGEYSFLGMASGGAATIAIDAQNTQIVFGNQTFSSWPSYFTGNAFLGSVGAANIRFGGADAASPASQTISFQNVLAGTSNTAGADTYFQASAGTGTGVGGKFHFQTALAGTTGSTQNAVSDEMTIDGASGVAILRGGNSVPQLSFAPNSGNGFALGMANSGSILDIFGYSSGYSGTAVQIAGFNGNGFVMNPNSAVLWTNTGGNVNTTIATSLSWIANGTLAVGTGGIGSFAGSLELTTLITAPLTYSTLPASPTVGQRAYITDGNSTTYYATVSSGGGSSKISVLYNGSNWIVD